MYIYALFDCVYKYSLKLPKYALKYAFILGHFDLNSRRVASMWFLGLTPPQTVEKMNFLQFLLNFSPAAQLLDQKGLMG